MTVKVLVVLVMCGLARSASIYHNPAEDVALVQSQQMKDGGFIYRSQVKHSAWSDQPLTVGPVPHQSQQLIYRDNGPGVLAVKSSQPLAQNMPQEETKKKHTTHMAPEENSGEKSKLDKVNAEIVDAEEYSSDVVGALKYRYDMLAKKSSDSGEDQVEDAISQGSVLTKQYMPTNKIPPVNDKKSSVFVYSYPSASSDSDDLSQTDYSNAMLARASPPFVATPFAGISPRYDAINSDMKQQYTSSQVFPSPGYAPGAANLGQLVYVQTSTGVQPLVVLSSPVLLATHGSSANNLLQSEPDSNSDAQKKMCFYVS